MIRIDGVNLRGERCTGLAQSVVDGATPELIIAAEHRLVIVADLPESRSAPKPRVPSALESGAGQLQIVASGRDLDISGIDQMLDRMDEDGSPLFGKRKSIQT
ncbi:hypothetical protein V491_08454 [Pseudogymnoascus sp. VKM F-3775]|nr:hypothetical protein V491_08454 [Pseudogymnoascus sp. VKM F-3775]